MATCDGHRLAWPAIGNTLGSSNEWKTAPAEMVGTMARYQGSTLYMPAALSR